MLETSARLLRLLSLLQSRRDWTSADLATRLGVTTRTIRNDMRRLRYARLSRRRAARRGRRVPARHPRRPSAAPPRRRGGGGSRGRAPYRRKRLLAGVEEASVRALAKLQQVLPSRLRHRISAFQSSTMLMPSRGPQVDPDVLTVVAAASRDHDRLRFDYLTHSGVASRRSVEPYRLLNDHRRWYLVAWDTDRDDWRTFRVDRIEPPLPTGPRFTPRALPPDREIAAQVARGVAEAPWRYRARVIVHAPAEYVRDRLPVPLEVQVPGRRPLRVRAGLGPSGDARPLSGPAGRGLHDPGLTRTRRRAPRADEAISASDRRQPEASG